jgi:hypothetical protein
VVVNTGPGIARGVPVTEDELGKGKREKGEGRRQSEKKT